LLSKDVGGADALGRLPELLAVYGEVLRRLKAAGARWVQIDEPCLALDLSAAEHAALRQAYDTLGARGDALPRLLLASYFAGLGDNAAVAFELPVAGVHLDLVRAPEQLSAALERVRPEQVLELGVIDGRNVWRADLSAQLRMLEQARDALGQARVWVATSCSLLHCPLDLDAEQALDGELRSWLAFAKQKAREVSVLARGLTEGRESIREELEQSDAVRRGRAASPRVHREEVRARLAAVTPEQ